MASDLRSKTIVQKFGGTSVGSGERLLLVANIIKKTFENNNVVVVVSALSPDKKANGTTSLLLKATKNAVAGDDYSEQMDLIRNYHFETADSAICDEALRQEARLFVSAELERIAIVLKAFSTLGESTAASLDSVISSGEKLSAKLLSLVLLDQGINATYEDLSDIVDSDVFESESDNVLFDGVQRALARRFGERKDSIPVLTGFFGSVKGGLLQRVGRGYTDFTAALVTAGLGTLELGTLELGTLELGTLELGASGSIPEISERGSVGCPVSQVSELQVWKEVDGICSADPRRVTNAKVLRELSVSEAAELTHFGSEVLHPFTMARVAQANIPIRVKNTFRPDLPGTLVVNRPPQHAQVISAITAKSGVTTVTVTSNRMYDTYGFLAQIFAILRDYAVVVDLVSTSEVSLSFTVEQTDNLLLAMNELEKLGAVAVASQQAILAVVGENMRNDILAPAKLFLALANAGIDIHMISKGASRINISCVISADCVDRALPAVHNAFFE